MRFFIPSLIALTVLISSACDEKEQGSDQNKSAQPTPAATATPTATPAAAQEVLPAKALAFKGTLSAGAGNCTALDVEARNSKGEASAVSSDASASLVSSSADLSFYSDSNCTKKVTSLTLSSGKSSATLYYKDTKAETVNITATDTSSLGLAAASGSLNVTSVAKLAFSGSAILQKKGDCGPLKLETQNSDGKAASGTADVKVSLVSTASTGSFYSDSACTTAVTSVTISSGKSESASFYYKDTAEGTPVLSASENPSQNWIKASMNATLKAN
ncbi:MAG: hypothetical protein HQK54_00565 [Oligoflexales bacterium]|nr:hypothetical protein [Oligoflexales bacterium]